jgi:glucose-6-phosphate 1-dehydrogenase
LGLGDRPEEVTATFVAFTMTLRRPRWLRVPVSAAPAERRARTMASVLTPDGREP